MYHRVQGLAIFDYIILQKRPKRQEVEGRASRHIKHSQNILPKILCGFGFNSKTFVLVFYYIYVFLYTTELRNTSTKNLRKQTKLFKTFIYLQLFQCCICLYPNSSNVLEIILSPSNVINFCQVKLLRIKQLLISYLPLHNNSIFNQGNSNVLVQPSSALNT